MFRINKIKGVNIGRHRLVEKVITGNVLGLWGVSGAGKSTILQLVEWIINGKIDHPDPIAEFVRCSEVEDIKKMEGFAECSVDGKPMEISRSHSKAGNSTRELKWDKQGTKWGTVEKGAAGVDALMASLVGANQKAISSIVFVRQGAFGKLFSGLDTERRDFFVRLLMLGHLEKIASIVDTYRKELLGSVKDLSALRDQSAAAYQQALKYFEEVDFDLSRMRSYKPDIDAGSELVRASDQLTTREADLQSLGTALDAGLVSMGMTRSAVAAWLVAKDAELTTLRESLQSANGRRTSRSTYEASKARLTNEISTIRAWMEKNAQHTETAEKLRAMEVDAGKPDPRIRIGQLDEWERNYREVAALSEKLSALPAADFAAVEALGAEAERIRKDESDANSKWSKAAGDLKDLRQLESAAHGHSTDGHCRLCGNDHPDPKFLTAAIANTQELEGRLKSEYETLEAARIAAAGKFTLAREDAAKKAEQIAAANKSLSDTKLLLAGAPDGASLAVERDSLYAGLAAWDAAKSMRLHLLETQRNLAAAMGPTSYTQNDLDSRISEMSLAEQMLAVLPPAEEIEASIKDLTDRGVALREHRDRLYNLQTNYENAQAFYNTQAATVEELLDRLAKDRPLLISSIQALGPVITSENRDKVLADFREKQTKFDEQTGLVAAARRALTDADTALQEIDVRIEEQKGRIQIGKELEAVRSAFLPSGITVEYLTHQFERIAVATQDHLAQMSADFMVLSSDKRALSFDFVRLNEPNGSWLNQNRMSGGQQVKLAIAVLLAIHELVIPQVGLLVLDEPSTHLDLESRIALAEVLREIGRRGNFQLIVCDHSPELKDAYTDIIELTADPV
jgi:DNA repair exonuclease SbcCD ATPase subunit